MAIEQNKLLIILQKLKVKSAGAVLSILGFTYSKLVTNSEFPDTFGLTTLKCPRCPSRDFIIKEVCEEIGEFECRSGIVQPIGYFYPGDIVSVSCECSSCGHEWVPRQKNNGLKAVMKDDFVDEFSIKELKNLLD